MNSPDSAARHEADEQAALWAAKLDGSSMTETDRAELDTWLRADARHRVLLSQYCQFSADLEADLPALVATGCLTIPATPPAKRRSAPWALWVAGSLAAATAAIVVGVSLHRPRLQTETIATSVAQRRTLELADGSIVELNARTSLLVDLGAHERHVRMADGEAFFTVAKDKSRPFIVETPAGSVRVTGTVFDVHADTAVDLTVTVVEGSVQVSPGHGRDGQPRAPVALTPNEQLVTAGNAPAEKHTLTPAEIEDALAWRRGEVVFDDTPLSSALARYARYHGRTIAPAAAVAHLRLSGRYRLDDLNAFLNAIEAFLPVQVSHESSGAIAVEPRTGG